jgi:hypothetical protein
MYKVLPAFLLFFLILSASAKSAFAQGSSSNKAASNQAHYVPDVVVLVFSGVMPADSVSCTYNKLGTTKEEAAQDVQTLGGLIRQSPAMVQISSRALPPSKDVQTGSEFQVNGLVDYKQGGFQIEPFISTFKRFKNIEIVYIVNGKFPFRGLTNYDDKHVSIQMLKPYQYRVAIKNSNFDSLNLPIVQVRESQAKSGSQGGLPKWLYAAVIAVLAGVGVYFGTKRFTKTA